MKPLVSNSLPISTRDGTVCLGISAHGGDSNQTPYGPGIYGLNWWFNGTLGTTG